MSRLIRRIICFLVVALILPVCSMTALATDHSTELKSLHFDIVLQEDGSAEIVETREVLFTGDYEYTRYGIHNIFTGPRIFEDWQVSIDGEPLSMLDAPDHEERPENTFAVEDGDGENYVYIYHRSNDVTRIFEISYRVENAMKLYSDVGEFHWNLTSENGVSGIATLTASVTVLDGIPEEDFRIWAHGPLNGTFEKQDTNFAYLQVEYVPLGEIVDMRITIPAYFFTDGWEQDGEALPEILRQEKELADSANAKREEERQREEEEKQREEELKIYWEQREEWEAKHPILAAIQGFCESIYDFFYYNIEEQLLGIVGFGSFWLFVLTAIFGKPGSAPKKLRHKPAESPKYYRNLPDNRPAPVVDKLLHFYKGNGNADTSRQISAALLEMNLKNLVRFHTSDKYTELILNKKFYQTPLPEYQVILWNFLQGASDGRGRIGVKELKKYVKKNEETSYRFRRNFDGAVNNAYTESVELQSLKLSGKKIVWIVPVIIGIIAFLVRMLSTLYDGTEFEASLTVGGIVFVVALIFVVVYKLGKKLSGSRCYILNKQAEDDLALWQAFGRFLDDFTTFEKKELPEFPVWREYMVYAVVMGKGKKVAKALAVKYPDAFSTETTAFDDEYYRFLQDMALYDAIQSIGHEVAAAKPPKTSSNSDNDNWSDSDGGGGGFSDSDGGSDSGSGGDFSD